MSDSMENQKRALELYQKIAGDCAEETFRHYVFQSGCEAPEKPALEWICKEQDKTCVKSVSYQKLMEDVVSLGTALYLHGWKKKTIAVLESRSYSWVLLAVTAMCSDICLVPIDCNENQEVLENKLRFCDASICFSDDPSAVTKSENKALEVFPFSDVCVLTEEGRRAAEQGEMCWILDDISEEQDSVMIFTSGTGGKLKLGVLSQGSFTLERKVRQGLGMDQSDSKCLITLPFFHIAGLIDLRGSLMLGLTAFISSGLKYLLEEYALAKPEMSFMVPAQAMLLYGVLMGKDKETARNLLGGKLRLIRTSGAPLPQNIRELFHSYGIEVTSDYGMTETSGPVSVSAVKDGRIVTKPGSVGHILDCLRVYAEDPDENGCGEIVVEGPCVFKGYYKDPEETAKIRRNGKIYTGDVGYVDEDRFLFLVGRKKNIIILSNGENIIPEELEKRVYRIPEIKECLVYEEKDKLAVKVYSDCCQDETYLTREIRKLNDNQPNHKQIRIIHIEKNPLPKTGTGKMIRG